MKKYLIEKLKALRQLFVSTSSITANDVQWVVNDNAELGVKIGGKFYWLYKWESLEYKDQKHDDGTPIKDRQVGKREFGECCHPLHLKRLPERYTEGEGWHVCWAIGANVWCFAKAGLLTTKFN